VRMFTATQPSGYVVALLLTVVWLLLWRASRRARLWFVAVAPGAAILCFPVGVVVGRVEMALVCAPDHPECAGRHAVDLWVNGMVGIGFALVLASLTLLVEAGLLLRRRLRAAAGQTPPPVR
jgi:hypothetical protein